MGGLTARPQAVRPAAPGQGALWYLDSVDSTNTWAKQNLALLGDLDAVYTADQTAGRGRLGRTWENCRGQGLYYTLVVRRPLVQPAALPLLASLAVSRVLLKRWGLACGIKWPNDLLLGRQKLCGILCEGVGGAYVCGIGINLCQPPEFFAQAGLPYGTSIYAATGQRPGPEEARQLALALADEGFAPLLGGFGARGFAAIREEYQAACVNLGQRVWFDGGEGVARGLDEEGRLLVETAGGSTAVFTGEVSVHGIYGAE